MLFFLTGDIQIGKTRWLEGVIRELDRDGVPSYGVIAPGRWVEHADGFEKLGINNVLLPQGECVNFADAAEVGWDFHQQAIERVNEHFAHLVSWLSEPAFGCERRQSGLLVVDELGWMELERGAGLTNAVALLDAGASRCFPHAIVVVRETLLSRALERFASADWGGVSVVGPDASSREALLSCVTNHRPLSPTPTNCDLEREAD